MRGYDVRLAEMADLTGFGGCRESDGVPGVGVGGGVMWLEGGMIS